MKLALDIGHNCYPYLGAVGISNECQMNLAVGKLLAEKLNNKGIIVILTKPKSANSVGLSLKKRVATANELQCDYFISIHHNAFNGNAHGAETFAVSPTGSKLAQNILDEIVKLGFYNRGVKNGRHLYVLTTTKMPAVLIEGCFVDSEKDMQLWNAEKMADAIFTGICNCLGI